MAIGSTLRIPDHHGRRLAARSGSGRSRATSAQARFGNRSLRSALQADPGSGQALDGAMRTRMESSFGTQFASVRLHPGSSLARGLGARALANGEDVHLASNQTADRQVIGHELAHVVQQRRGLISSHSGIDRQPQHERQADTWGRRAAAGAPAGAGTVTASPAGRGTAQPYLGQIASWFTGMLPGMSEENKDTVDPRRWRINPYWRHHRGGAHAYENAHIPYHSVDRHGAENTIANIKNRTVTDPALGGQHSRMIGPISNASVNRFHTSGRFATTAWHNYSRNMAISRFSATVPAPGPPGTTWNWVPGNIPNGATTHAFRINITYQNTISGLAFHNADPAANLANAGPTAGVDTVFSLIKYDTATGNAAVIQHFPTNGPYNAGAANLNVVIPYAQVPWFSTAAH